MRARGGALIALFFAACAGDQGKPDPWKLWTLAELQSLARAGKPLGTTGIPATSFVTPRGQPLEFFSPPFAATQALQQSSTDGLVVDLAFAEGATASYATTEVWQNFDEVWVQPLYLFVSGFDPITGAQFLPSKPVFGIGTQSRFYSSYWQVMYVTVPKDLPADSLRSVKAILDSGYPITPGAGTFCALGPADLALAQPQGAAGPTRPLFGDAVNVRYSQGWVDDQPVSYIDFGRHRFTWHGSDMVVDESALFDLSIRTPDGSFQSLGLPKIGGTGPLLSNTPPRVINGKPEFGTLWHLYRALLPATAGVFIPSTRPALRAKILAAANQTNTPPAASMVPPIAPANESDPDALKYTLRVAANPACFQDPNFKTTCRWLDSQASVEREIPAPYIEDSDVYASCPFLTFDDVPVQP